jgi:ribonuclease BN (tRNA processing enzyme)
MPRMWGRVISRCALAWIALGAASALVAAPAANTPRTEILFLGTSGGPPLKVDRSEPATLLMVDGREYLIDCGIGTARRMIRAGIDSKYVRTIFFTHLHADHDLGLADVMANDFSEVSDKGGVEHFNIYGPPQTRELVDAAFHYLSVGFRPFAAENPAITRNADGSFPNPFVAHEFNRDGLVFQDDKIRVTAVQNSHYALMSPGDRAQLKSYSYRIETPHGVVVFTGDTGPSEAVAQLAKGADVLIAEASYRDRADLDQFMAARAAGGHWTAARTKTTRDHFLFGHLDTAAIGQLASKAGVKAVILYHYGPNGKADQAAYVAGVKRDFGGPVFASDDLARYCLGSGALAPCAHEPAR